MWTCKKFKIKLKARNRKTIRRFFIIKLLSYLSYPRWHLFLFSFSSKITKIKCNTISYSLSLKKICKRTKYVYSSWIFWNGDTGSCEEGLKTLTYYNSTFVYLSFKFNCLMFGIFIRWIYLNRSLCPVYLKCNAFSVLIWVI